MWDAAMTCLQENEYTNFPIGMSDSLIGVTFQLIMRAKRRRLEGQGSMHARKRMRLERVGSTSKRRHNTLDVLLVSLVMLSHLSLVKQRSEDLSNKEEGPTNEEPPYTIYITQSRTPYLHMVVQTGNMSLLCV